MEELGFKYIRCPFNGKYIWQYIMSKSKSIEYNPENNVCKFYGGEFSSFARKCETLEEIQKFIDCVNFIFPKLN